jgi:palmitoyltransferase
MKEEALDKVELRKDKEIIDKVSSKIFQIILKKDEISIINELDKNEYSDVDLTLCIDTAHNNNTILTTLVNLNLSRAVNYFISIVKSYKKLYSELKSYINKENSKGYNALLYSAFRGNLQVFTTLMENGADINSVTSSSGLNALHLAAQGNYPNIIIYLIEKYGMNINSQDNKGNSALHWAVYMDKKQAVDYLIYYNIDTNLRDNDNDTALDIAKRRGNKLFVKLFQEDYVLLDKKKGKDVKVDIKQSQSELNKEKKGFGLLIKSIINKFFDNEHPSVSYAYPFLIFVIFVELFNQVIILRGYKNYFMSMVFCILFSMLLFFYLTASKSDAGEIFSKCINSLILLAEQGEDMKNICPWCINYTNDRTNHCFLCKKCFENQEFHEPFINNCVGSNNFSLYMSFLFFFTINFGFKLIISMWAMFWLKNENLKRTIGFIIPQILAVILGIVFGVMKIKKNLKLSYEINFGNLFIKDIKDNNNDNDTNITISNSMDKNSNIQLSTLGQSKQNL